MKKFIAFALWTLSLFLILGAVGGVDQGTMSGTECLVWSLVGLTVQGVIAIIACRKGARANG